MSQFKIYGHRTFLEQNTDAISHAIHQASMKTLGPSKEKRFHRFMPMEPRQMITPPDRSERYLNIEVLMFEGCSIETKKAFYWQLLAALDLPYQVDYRPQPEP